MLNSGPFNNYQRMGKTIRDLGSTIKDAKVSMGKGLGDSCLEDMSSS